MPSSSNFLSGFLQAIAGNGHDVSWSRALNNLTLRVEDEFTALGKVTAGTIHRNLYTVATGIYPVEVDDQMTATGWLVNGFMLANQIESFQPAAQLTSGEVIDILVPVEFTQYPEAFQPAAQLTAGLIYEAYTPRDFTQYPEAFQPAAQLLSGTIIDEPGVLVRNPDETMTSTAWLVDGTLE